VLAGFFEFALHGEGFGQMDVNGWVGFVQIQRALPAVNGFVEEAAIEQAVGDVEVAAGAFFLVWRAM